MTAHGVKPPPPAPSIWDTPDVASSLPLSTRSLSGTVSPANPGVVSGISTPTAAAHLRIPSSSGKRLTFRLIFVNFREFLVQDIEISESDRISLANAGRGALG